MNEEEIIPDKSLRKLDALFLHNEILHQNKELQLQIMAWAKELMAESRKEWCELHKMTIDTVIKLDRTQEAKRKSEIKDKKYAPFREYFYKIQKEKYLQTIQNGHKLTANSFVEWFLVNKCKIGRFPM